jgi:hypothetical protein
MSRTSFRGRKYSIDFLRGSAPHALPRPAIAPTIPPRRRRPLRRADLLSPITRARPRARVNTTDTS